MLHTILKKHIQEMSLEKIIEEIFQEYPDVISYLDSLAFFLDDKEKILFGKNFILMNTDLMQSCDENISKNIVDEIRKSQKNNQKTVESCKKKSLRETHEIIDNENDKEEIDQLII